MSRKKFVVKASALKIIMRAKALTTVIVILLLCVTVRLLPYLAPIRTADIAQDKQAIAFTDRNGLLLGTLLTRVDALAKPLEEKRLVVRHREHTAVVPLNQVSPQFIQAILAAEDSDFYHHGALDIKAIARAIKDAIHANRILSGASTITMQLARMLNSLPRTVSGKTQEV